VPLNRRNFANMRAILYFPAEKVETVDWLADEAVRCELLSSDDFPDHQGKYREFSRFRVSQTRFAPEKASSSFGFLSKFPTQPNRELFSSNREFNRRIRVFSSENRENAFAVIRRDEPCE